MAEGKQANELRRRGERLYPKRTSRTFWVLTKLREAYEQAVSSLGEGGRRLVLYDYGSGTSPYRPLFDDLGVDYITCDFPGNDMADAYLDEDGNLPFGDASADIVLSSQVLEHVYHVDKYLGEAWRVLRSDGTLILSTHGVWKYHPDPGDYWRWTCDGLRLTVESAGFAVRKSIAVVGPTATGIQLFQDGLYSRLPRALTPGFVLLCQSMMQLMDRFEPRGRRDRDACKYVLVATRAERPGGERFS